MADDGKRNGQDHAKAVAAVRAGGTPVVTNPIGSPCPYPMLENITEDMTRVSQAFRLPTGMIVRG